ncbi:MAG: hypothetical protein V3T21_01280 [Candidatus Margulisiibacteriota bacterium]
MGFRASFLVIKYLGLGRNFFQKRSWNPTLRAYALTHKRVLTTDKLVEGIIGDCINTMEPGLNREAVQIYQQFLKKHPLTDFGKNRLDTKLSQLSMQRRDHNLRDALLYVIEEMREIFGIHPKSLDTR